MTLAVRKIVAFTLRTAIAGGVAAVLILGTLLYIPSIRSRFPTAFNLVRKTVLFPRMAWTKAQGCSISAAWMEGYERPEQDPFARLNKVVQTDPAGLELVETPSHGRWWVPSGNSVTLGHTLKEIEEGLYEESTHGVRPGDVALDCGANVGVYTRHALRSGARSVVAVELAPENIECLRRNFSREIAAGTVIVYPKGVWDRDDQLALQRPRGRSSTDDSVFFHESGGSGPIVPLTTIDELVADLYLERVDFIKLDIEGAERQALAGARETMRRFRPRMAIAVEHLPDDLEVILALVKEISPNVQFSRGRCEAILFPHTDHARVQPDIVFGWFEP
jgi:FkbM family methyltransferase